MQLEIESLLNITPVKCIMLQALVYISILQLGFHFRLDCILDFGNFGHLSALQIHRHFCY